MKRIARFTFILAVMALTALTASSSFAQEAAAPSTTDFCWLDTTVRDVGEVPEACAENQQMIGLLCYDNCGVGKQRVGIDCHSVCPSGMADQGLFCRKSEYGRGAGYAWQPNTTSMQARCETDNGAGKCEQYGLVWYPKCQAGYTAFGCCLCRPTEKPNCDALNLGSQVDLSCAKKIEIGSSPKLGICASDEELNAGLCYDNCPAGYHGVGPVCWRNPPEGWVNCGMGAAKTDGTCASVVWNQVSSVGQLALTIATVGTSLIPATAANTAADVGRVAQLKAMYADLKAAYDAAKSASPALQAAERAYNVGSTALKVTTVADSAANIVTEEDILRLAAQIAAIVNSSGISAVTGSYTYSKCSKLFPNDTSGISVVSATYGENCDEKFGS